MGLAGATDILGQGAELDREIALRDHRARLRTDDEAERLAAGIALAFQSHGGQRFSSPVNLARDHLMPKICQFADALGSARESAEQRPHFINRRPVEPSRHES